jgi:hypothetical protein
MAIEPADIPTTIAARTAPVAADRILGISDPSTLVTYSPSLFSSAPAGVSGAATGITAGTTQTQAGATALTAQFNSVDTNATAGNGVSLPASSAGSYVVVTNNTTKTLQVYGTSPDTINGVATATGITLPAGATAIFVCYVAGKWFTQSGLGSDGQIATILAVSGITAGATQTQAGATALTAALNVVSTNAAAGNGVKLPASTAGLEVSVVNNTSNALQVYGTSTDTINGATNTVGVSQPANSVATYFCPVAGTWFSNGGYGFSGQLGTQLAVSGITSGTTQTQAGATLLTAPFNSVDTNATAGNGVALPASAPGLQIVVLNTTSKTIQVYGTGSDTVNGATNTVGITQPALSTGIYICVAAGKWITATGLIGWNGQLPTFSAVSALTAHSGGGQGSGIVPAVTINNVTTVAAGNDSMTLPVSAAGMFFLLANSATTNSMNLFPASGETINALSANTAFAVAAGKRVLVFCAVAGNWLTILTA